MKRLTETEKWSEPWFIELNNQEKIMYFYISDNVDNAGFMEISYRKIIFDLQINEEEIKGAIKGLARGLINFNKGLDMSLIFFEEGLKNGSVIFLKGFLQEQKNYPLSPFNPFHNNALKIFLKRKKLVLENDVLCKIHVKGENKKTKEEIDLFLIDYIKKKQGLPSPIVNVNVNVKEKVGVKEKVIFGKSENLLKIKSIKKEINNEFTWRETICKNLKQVFPNFTEKDFFNYLEQFLLQLENDGEEVKSLKETKKHFSRWLNIELKKDLKNGIRNKETVRYSDDFKREIFSKLQS